MEIFNEHGLTPPATWTEQMEVSQALKQAGLGLSPWPREGETGNCWPLALQILPPMMQEVCIDMDADNDFFVGIEEALPAHKAELIGPLHAHLPARLGRNVRPRADLGGRLQHHRPRSPLARRLGPVCSTGPLGNSLPWPTTPTWTSSALSFPRQCPPLPTFPPPLACPAQSTPMTIRPATAMCPGEHVQAIRGPQDVMLKSSTEMRGNRDQVINWWQFITEPENNAFLNNENQQYIPSARDAKLGPLWSTIGGYKLPLYTYTIAWWGHGASVGLGTTSPSGGASSSPG